MVSSKLWRVTLLGGLRLEGNGDTVNRFRSQKIGAVLAYLALFPRRTHTREELADLFWPDADPTAGRTNLRTGLASLRRQLEPPGVEARSVLVTRGHSDVLLNSEAYKTDVAGFEKALRGLLQARTELGEESLNPPDVRAEAQGPRYRKDWDEGSRMTTEQAVAYALDGESA